MPPWPTRLAPGSPAGSNSPSRPTSRGLRAPPFQSRQIDQYQDPPLLGVPILAPDSIPNSRSSQRSRHEESHSYPFPSIFGNGRKMDRELEADFQDDTLDDFYDSPTLSPGLASKGYMASENGLPQQHAEKDLVTGKCSTCDSVMRWPCQVQTFRCTVCLMINDLKPSEELPGNMRAPEAPGPSLTPSKPGPLRKGTKYSWHLSWVSDI